MLSQISGIGIVSPAIDVFFLGDVQTFPRTDDIMPIIAPLWTDFRSVNTMYRVIDDPVTLQLVREMISSRNPKMSNYQPSLAVVVTVVDVEISFHAHLDVRTFP
jgi:hypothetical protein